MKKIITFLGVLVFLSMEVAFAQTVIFTENFESGSANAAWATYYKNEDKLVAKPMANAPQALTGGGNYVGLLQDIDVSYTGSAVATAGDLSLKDYSIEADVYCYVNNAGGSAYTGLVVYADSSKRDFFKTRVDFDASNRINLSGLKSDPATFMPLFSKDFKGTDNAGLYPTTDGWHKLKLEVRTVSDSSVSFSVYFDNKLLTGCPISYTKSGVNNSGGFGLYSFQQSTGIAAYFDNIVVTQLAPLDPPSTVIFTENFESGSADASWATYYKNEDKLVAKPMANAPQALATGGNYVGLLQDIDVSYTGSAVATAGDLSLKDYSIEADVYCYVNNAGGSAYTGLVVYADSSKRDFFKTRVDFDASNRINLSGLKSDPATFMPLFSKDFKGTDNVGLYPTTDGWHKLKLEVRTVSDSTVSFSVYFDNKLLTGCPISYTKSGVNNSGGFGLYSFQQSTGIAAYFDNIIVTQLAPNAVEDNAVVPTEFSLLQNYPNPFNPSTTINYNLPTSGLVSLNVYDLLGREVASLVSTEQSAGQHSATWNGKNNSGNAVPSGVYLYSLSSGNIKNTMKMILMK